MSAPAYLPKFPKFAPGHSLAEDRDAKRRAEDDQLDAVHQHVDRRDGQRCRLCGRPCAPGAVRRKDRAERHHLIPRSLGGPHTHENVLVICLSRCHDGIHKFGILRARGNAEQRDPRSGTFNGVKLEKFVGGSWRVIGWR